MVNTTEKNSKESLNWKFLLLLSTGYLALSVNQQGFLALLPFLREEFMLSRAQAGLYNTFFFLSATTIAIFSGRLVDLLGSKKGMLLGVGSVGCFMILQALAPTYNIILMLALMMGVGFSLLTPAVTKGVMESVLPKNRATSMGIMQTGLGIGGFAGASFLPILGGIYGWRSAIILSGIFAFLIVLVIQILYREDSQKRDIKKSNKEEQKTSFKKDFLILIRNKKLLWICILGHSFGLTVSAVVSHYAIFLHQDLGKSMALAGLGLGVLQVGGLLGRPTWGWLSDRIFHGNRRMSIIAMSLIICFMFIIFGIFVNNPAVSHTLILILSFIMGFAVLSSMTLLFTTAAELAGEKYTGTATGLALIFSRLGMLVSPPLFGLIADLQGNYSYSWIIWGVVCVIFTTIFTWKTAGESKK